VGQEKTKGREWRMAKQLASFSLLPILILPALNSFLASDALIGKMNK